MDSRSQSRRRWLTPVAAAALSLALAAPGLAAPPGPTQIALPGGWAPEGITAGPDTTVFVGSAFGGGGIYQADVRTGEGSILVQPTGTMAIGTEYEADANRLWVAGGATAEVRVYDASSGALLETYELGHIGFLNDLVVTDTAVYVTDSPFDHLDVLPFGPDDALPDPADVHQLTLGGGFELLPGFNLNGIVEARGWLIAVQSNAAKLWRIDPETGEATEISLGAGVNVMNGDGLELHGRTLFVVQNQLNRVAVFELGPQLQSATRVALLEDPDPDPLIGLSVPTTAAWIGGALYVVNARFGTPVTPDTPYWITRLDG
jgi:sugar lactone lactonase YvrE